MKTHLKYAAGLKVNDERQVRWRKRIGQILAAYWAVTLFVGLVLPAGGRLQEVFAALRPALEALGGLNQLASHSFDPGYVGTYVMFCLAWWVVLAIGSCFWVPGGSAKGVFPDVKSKVVFVLLGLVLLVLSLMQPLNEHSGYGLSQGRIGALLYLGASSKAGALIVLNAWFGFIPLFFFLALRAGLTTPVR